MDRVSLKYLTRTDSNRERINPFTVTFAFVNSGVYCSLVSLA